MARTISFNDLRALKDKLPDGSIVKIAEKLGLITTEKVKVRESILNRVLMEVL